MKELPCVIHTDRKVAIRSGLESNGKHGVPLSKEDRIKCTVIAISELLVSSNREIAKMLGCSSRWIDQIVIQYNLRDPDKKVLGKDGKWYGASKELGADDPEPKKSDPAKMQKKTERSLEKLLTALKSFHTDDQERVTPLIDVVKTIVSNGFTDDAHRREFLKRIQNEVVSVDVGEQPLTNGE